MSKLFVPSSLLCQVANADKGRCRKARPSNRGCVLEARCAIQGLRFSNPFINLYGYIYFSSCFSFLLQIDGFLFSFFFVFKVVYWFPFEVVNFYSDNFFLTTADLTDWCLFQFYLQIIFFRSLSHVCLFVCVVLLLGKRKYCLALLQRFHLV